GAADGSIIPSTFTFANKPTAIFIAVPGHKDRYVAKEVARDTTRMLTLLKIDANNLPVPAFVPEGEMRIGQTALAMGRGLDTLERLPTVSVGIISALHRIWGKARQTDAKVAPLNYGGPLLGPTGRAHGIPVPGPPHRHHA